jgi:hypothetical protein
VDDASVTEETVADAVVPRADREVISPAKACPFWSRLTRSDVGVEPLKNFFQLDLIVAIVAVEPPDDELVAGADVGVPVAAGVELGLELELLPEQAVIAAASTRASAGARKIRRAKRWNRIRCASLGCVGFGCQLGERSLHGSSGNCLPDARQAAFNRRHACQVGRP